MSRRQAIIPLVLAASSAVLWPAHAAMATGPGTEIERLLTFRGPATAGVSQMDATVRGCEFILTAVSTEDGIQYDGSLQGSLFDVTSADIELLYEGTEQFLNFSLTEHPPGWVQEVVISSGNDMYDTLVSDPHALLMFSAVCDETGCVLSFDPGDEWDQLDLAFDLTGVLNNQDAAALLAAFRELADVCSAPSE